MSTPFPLLGPAAELITFGLGGPPDLPIDPSYTANINPSDITKVIGSSPILDARLSDINGNPPKYFYWSFVSIPIGSQVSRYGFQDMEEDSSIVRFSPDKIGFYRISLVVGDDVAISSPVYTDVYIKYILVPHGQSMVPDVSFIWDYLGDFWNLIVDKEIYSTLWSSYTQIFSNYLLSLYQIDRNKSINTIQDFFQKKWLNYDSDIVLDTENSFVILGDDLAGSHAQAVKFNTPTEDYTDQISIPASEGSFSKTFYGKKIGKRNIRYWKSSHTLDRADDASVILIGPPLKYSILFTKSSEILKSTTDKFWRLSSTLGHQTINFEEQGVKSGDYIKFRINLFIGGANNNSGSILYLPISSVRNNKVGFVWDENLIDGVPSPPLSVDRMLKLAADLKIDGIVTDISGNLVYLPNSLGEFIKNAVNSVAFKLKYFEEELFFTQLDIGVFNGQKITVLIEPLAVIRNKSIRLADEVLGIQTLQEFIEQPNISEDNGNKFIVKNDAQSKVTPIYRDPLFLYENLDYIVKDEKTIIYGDFTANSDTVVLQLGDLIDRSYEQGDFLLVSGLNGTANGDFKQYVITDVLDKVTVRLLNPTPFTANKVKCYLVRRLKGNFLRYVDNTFQQDNIGIRKKSIEETMGKRLWAEVTYIDNGKYVEDNFGSIVRITREQLKNKNVTAPYKNVVAGLLYGLVQGPSMRNLKIGAQILLGLPFAYYRGRVVDIINEYSFRIDLSPEYGKIVIEEIDEDNKPTGLVSNYFYPKGKQVFSMGSWVPTNPDFSGLSINPSTGVEYKVGDIVEQFAPLSKGVEIVDYLTDPEFVSRILTNPQDQLRKYHTFFVRANTDIFSNSDMNLVYNFISEAKPAYLFSKVISEKNFSDIVLVTDHLYFSVINNFFDITGLSLPGANKFDYYIDGNVIYTVDGKIYSRYIKGNDLAITGSNATSNSGGFINPRVNEEHDSPYILPDDRLIIYNGINQGSYVISNIASDTSISVSGSPFSTEYGLKFAIYREIKNPILNTGLASAVLNNNTIQLPAGDLSAGIAVGDKVFLFDAFKIRDFRIVNINGTTITVDRNFPSPTGNYQFVVYREALLTKYLLSDPTTYIFTATLVSGDPWIALSGSLIKNIIKKGDTLYNDTYPQFEILDYDETINAVYVTPTPSVNDTVQATVFRNSAPEGFPIDVDFICTQDVPKLEIVPSTSTAVTIAGNSLVTFSIGTNLSTWNILPGDFFVVKSGPDSLIDIGYGVGVYVIAEVQVNQLTLTRPLTSNQNTLPYGLLRVVSF